MMPVSVTVSAANALVRSSTGPVWETSWRILDRVLPPFSNSDFTRSREAVISCPKPLSCVAICDVSCTTVPEPEVPVSAPPSALLIGE